MDPLTLAIVTALGAGVVGGVTKMGEQAAMDAYEALKTLLKKKFGFQSDVVQAVEGLEKKPDSTGHQTLLQEEVAAAKADEDPELLQAAQTLLSYLSVSSGDQRHVQQASGHHIAQADRGSTATVNS